MSARDPQGRASRASARRPHAGLAAGLALALAAAAPPAGAERWRIEVVDGPHVEPGDLELRSDGEPVAAWGGESVRVATRNAGTWTVETVTSEPGSYWSVSLELDSADRPQVAWHDHEAGTLHLGRFDGSAWNEETVEGSGAIGAGCSLALDAAGRPRISARDDASWSLVVARHDGSAWSLETVRAGGDTGTWSSLVIDAAGREWIAYRDEEADALELSVGAAGAWTHETVDAESSGWFARLLLASGEPAIVHERRDSGLLVSRREAGAWVHDELGIGDPASRPAVAPGGGLRVAAASSTWLGHDGAAWSSESAPTVFGQRVGAAIVDAEDRAWVLGFDARTDLPGRNAFDAGAVLVSVREPDGTWRVEPLIDGSASRFGLQSSLAVDSLDRAALAWLSESNELTPDRRLWFARREPGGWPREEVAAARNLGWFTLAHGPGDAPAIAYLDGTTARLAERETGAWAGELVAASALPKNVGLVHLPSGEPLVSFHASGLLAASREAGAWPPAEWIDGLPTAGELHDLALLPSGEPAVTYQSNLQWFHAERSEGEWTAVVVDPTNNSGIGCSLDVAADGRRWSCAARREFFGFPWSIHCAWSDDGLAWTIEQVSAIPNFRAPDLSVSVGPDGRPAVAYPWRGRMSVSVREADGSWTHRDLPEAAVLRNQQLAHDSSGALVLAYQGSYTARVARLEPELLLHRGVVADLGAGWREAALPLTADNDDETPPFPRAVVRGGSTPEASAPEAPLVLYRVLADGGGPAPGVVLRVEKQPGTAELLLSH